MFRHLLSLAFVLLAGCSHQDEVGTVVQANRPGREGGTLISEQDRWLANNPCWRRVGAAVQHIGWRNCLKFPAPSRMRGVWFTGFEESGFVPDVTTVSLTRDSDHMPELNIDLEANRNAVLRQMRSLPRTGCPLAIALEFIGRRATIPHDYSGGFPREAVIVDRLISARLVGVVRTRGVPGYDQECTGGARLTDENLVAFPMQVLTGVHAVETPASMAK